jgi:GTPase SAR1 family protein
MGLLERFRESKFSKMIQKVFGKKHAKIGIYGPPNVGKTTLANRILRDWKYRMRRAERNGRITSGSITVGPH